MTRQGMRASRQMTGAPNPALALDRRGSLGPHLSVQRDATGPMILPASSTVREAIESPAQTLDNSTRREMETRFGYDLSAVRLHTGDGASASARALGARAYTSGSNIVFADGAYQPESPSGRRLLAHELAHVIQQSTGPVAGVPIGGGMQVSDPGDTFERQASRFADDAYGSHTWNASHPGHSPGSARMHNRLALPSGGLAAIHDAWPIPIQRQSDGWAIAGTIAGIAGAVFGGLALVSAINPTTGGFNVQHASVPYTPAKTESDQTATPAPARTQAQPRGGKGGGAQQRQQQPPAPTAPAHQPIRGSGANLLSYENNINKFKVMEISAPTSTGGRVLSWLTSFGQIGEDSLAEVYMNLRCDGHDIHQAFTTHKVSRGYSGGIFKDDATLTIRGNAPQNPVSDPAEIPFNFDGVNNPVGPGFTTFSGLIQVNGRGTAEVVQVNKTGGDGDVRVFQGYARVSSHPPQARNQSSQSPAPAPGPAAAGATGPASGGAAAGGSSTGGAAAGGTAGH